MSEPYRVPFRFRLSRPALKAVFRLIFHILGRVKVIGKENIPFGKPYVVAINHISLYDPPLAAAFWPEVLEIMGASDVFARPGQGKLLRLYGVIPVHRGEYDRTLLQRVVSVVKAGYPLLIAPEGGRSHVTAMRRAYPGVAYIVEETNIPVVPVGLVGTTDDFWQRSKRGERPHLEMRIGLPITLPPITEKGAARRDARQRNADLVMQHLAGLLPEEYRGVYAASAIVPAKTGQ
ncbi:MAG: 1-acyl-sn-glycerol-3-phosphate acyltransferase [Anaerolineales bacterium]|nr:1-acyl-sn-glycerol-3-phosphate acyltransferase [Anaerolineales bacterium]